MVRIWDEFGTREIEGDRRRSKEIDTSFSLVLTDDQGITLALSANLASTVSNVPVAYVALLVGREGRGGRAVDGEHDTNWAVTELIRLVRAVPSSRGVDCAYVITQSIGYKYSDKGPVVRTVVPSKSVEDPDRRFWAKQLSDAEADYAFVHIAAQLMRSSEGFAEGGCAFRAR